MVLCVYRCRCILDSIDIPVTIADKHGRIIKTFHEAGLKNIENAIFWVWREVLLALLASKDKASVGIIPSLLVDVDDLVNCDDKARSTLPRAP